MSKIRLTETQLHKMIKESVRKILMTEDFNDDSFSSIYNEHGGTTTKNNLTQSITANDIICILPNRDFAIGYMIGLDKGKCFNSSSEKNLYDNANGVTYDEYDSRLSNISIEFKDGSIAILKNNSNGRSALDIRRDEDFENKWNNRNKQGKDAPFYGQPEYHSNNDGYQNKINQLRKKMVFN